MAKSKPAPPPPLELVAEMPRGGHACSALSFSPDGRLLAAAAGDRRLQVYDVQAGRRLYDRRDATGGIGEVAFSHDGRLVATCGEGKKGGEVVIQDATDGSVLARVPLKKGGEDEAVSLAFSPDGKSVVCSVIDYEDEASYLAKINIKTGKLSGTIPAEPDACEFAFSPDGKTLVGRFDDRLVLWDFPAGKERKTIPVKGRAAKIAISPDGKTIAIVQPQGAVQLHSATTGKALASLAEKNPVGVEKIAFSLDGKRLATIGTTMHGDSKADVRIWDLKSKKVQLAFEGRHGVEYPQGFPGECAISPDFQFFANAGNQARLWRIKWPK
jgi:WD40 repeat protein